MGGSFYEVLESVFQAAVNSSGKKQRLLGTCPEGGDQNKFGNRR